MTRAGRDWPAPTPAPWSPYLHSGQQPVAATLVAAPAAVPNIATNAAARANSFIFIIISNRHEGGPTRHAVDVKASSRVEGQALDLEVDLKVF